MTHQLIAPQMHEKILEKLEHVSSTEDVNILFAIESGSRAWGFPSPDSDYDVRFVYAQKPDWYLTIYPGRDVLEYPIEGDLDVNGWDIKKSLGLLIKPNPVLLEWLASPIRYMWDKEACSAIQHFASEITHAKSCLYHYLNLGSRQWRAYIEGKSQVNLKKYLYVVRPAMAIRWIRVNPDTLPPMNFFELKDGISLPDSVEMHLGELIEKKRTSKEMGEGESIPDINKFIVGEFEWAQQEAPAIAKDSTSHIQKADELFRAIIQSK